MAWISRRAGVVVVGLVHALLVASLLSEPAEIAETPIRNIDYGPHFYHAHHATESLLRSGPLWGSYDPFWMAGYPSHVGLLDNKIFCALLFFAPSAWKILFFNGGVLAALAAVPWLIAAASRTAGGSDRDAAGAALAATICTFSVPAVVMFWCWGGISFFFASVIAVPVTFALARTLTEESLFSRRGLTASLGASLAVFIHPLAAPILALGLLPVLWSGPRSITPRFRDLVVLGTFLALPLLPIAENNLWLRGLFRPADPRGDALRGGMQQLKLDWWVHLFGSKDLFFGAGGLLLIVPLAVFGAFIVRRDGASRSGRSGIVEQAIIVEIVGCALATYVAPSLVTRFALLQPYRLLIPLAFFACIPAGRGIARLMSLALERRLAPWAAAALGIVIVGSAVRGRVPLLVLGYGHDTAESALVARFARQTQPDERILVESTHKQLPVEGRLERVIVVRRFALLPLLVEREFLGYVGTAPFLAHRYAGFEGERLFGKRLAGLTETEFTTLLSRYGVSWIVACTADALAGLGKFTGVLDEDEPAADCRVFRVRNPERSRFLEGSGEVRAMLDRLEVTHAVGDRLVLKYHWMPNLRTDPPLPLEEARQPGASVGFIAIRPGATTHFTIRLGSVLERMGVQH